MRGKEENRQVRTKKSKPSSRNHEGLLNELYLKMVFLLGHPKVEIGHFTMGAIIFVGAREHSQTEPAARRPAFRKSILTDDFPIHKNVRIVTLDDQCKIRFSGVIKFHNVSTASGRYRL